jgi:hypothetical protein
MNFYLQPAFLNPPPPLEIKESEYADLASSRLILNAVFSLEENYDLLVGNYLELENSLLSLSAATMVRYRHEYQDMFELTAEMNRRAVNFLSSARLFVDQILQRVGSCCGDADEVKKQLSLEYDRTFEYRFMEALRNHVQHTGSAIHGLATGGSWWPRHEKQKHIFALEVYTQRSFLELDPKFKKSTLRECPEKVNFMRAAREYLKSLSIVHDFARKNIKAEVDAARSCFENAIDRYKVFSAGSAVGLAAVARLEGKASRVSVLLEWDDVRLRLEKRNRSLKNLNNSIIASEMIPNIEK